MEPILRAKVKVFFEGENLKNAFIKKWWAYRVYTVKLGNKELFGHPKIVP